MKRAILAGVVLLSMVCGARADTIFTYYTKATASAVAYGFTLDEVVIFRFQTDGTNTADQVTPDKSVWNGSVSEPLWLSISMETGTTNASATSGFGNLGNILETAPYYKELHARVSTPVSFRAPNNASLASVEVFAENMATFALTTVGTTIDTYFLTYEGTFTPTGSTEIVTRTGDDLEGRFQITSVKVEVVPEPSTFLLLGLGGGVLLLLKKRRKA